MKKTIFLTTLAMLFAMTVMPVLALETGIEYGT